MFSNAVTVLAQSDLSPPTERINAVAASVSMREHSTSTELAVEPCEKGQDKRTSDLCAQWKAADAAALAAEWTERTFWLGVLGTTLGAATLVSAFWAAQHALRAAVATEKTADIAREIGQLQTRAYIGLDTLTFELVKSGDDGSFIGVQLTPIVRNAGNSPAFCHKLWSQMVLVEHRSIVFPTFEISDVSEDKMVLSSNANVNLHSVIFDRSIIESVQRREFRAFHMVYVKYGDVFSQADDHHIFTCCNEVRFHMPMANLEAALSTGLPNGAISSLNHSYYKIWEKEAPTG